MLQRLRRRRLLSPAEICLFCMPRWLWLRELALPLNPFGLACIRSRLRLGKAQDLAVEVPGLHPPEKVANPSLEC